MTALHVGEAIWEWLRDQYAAPDALPETALLKSLYGLPVIVEADFHGGRWEARDVDTIVAQGQVGDPAWTLLYHPGVGFVGINPDALQGQIP